MVHIEEVKAQAEIQPDHLPPERFILSSDTEPPAGSSQGIHGRRVKVIKDAFNQHVIWQVVKPDGVPVVAGLRAGYVGRQHWHSV
jgi:hypothetical protein